MCVNCKQPNQHFSDGQKDRSRPMQSSKEQGTSPDWGGRSASSSGDNDSDGDSRAVATGKRRAAELFSNASDPNWLGI